jgi:3-oxoadipate enol-lactonase
MHTLSLLAPRGNTLSVTAAGHGMPLFLLHGFPLDHLMWSGQLQRLSKDFRVIAIDLRGFGKSSLDAPSYSIIDLADDVEFVRSHLAANERITLCGLSMGGYVAFEYWRRHGQHLAGLVLANTKPDADSEQAKSGRLQMAAVAQSQGAWPAISGMLEKLLSKVHQQPGSEVYRQVEQIMRGCRAEAISAAQHAMANRADFVPHLAAIDVPTLVLTGEQDQIAPPEATRHWASSLPSARFIVLPEAAHLTPLEAGHEFARHVTEFMQSLVARTR